MGTTRKADYFGRTVIAAVVGLQFVLRSRKSAAGEKQNSGLRGVVFTAPFRVYLICAFAVCRTLAGRRGLGGRTRFVISLRLANSFSTEKAVLLLLLVCSCSRCRGVDGYR